MFWWYVGGLVVSEWYAWVVYEQVLYLQQLGWPSSPSLVASGLMFSCSPHWLMGASGVWLFAFDDV